MSDRRVDPDRLAELEDERRFLLRSLRDLDAELAAGDVDDVDYETLRDGYTKRAADVLRAIEEGRAALPPKAPAPVAAHPARRRDRRHRRRRRRGARRPHRRAALAGSDDHRRRPDGATSATLLAQARTMFGVDARGASDLYRQVLDADPRNVEALTYQAWLIYVNSVGANDELRVEAVETAQPAADPGRRGRPELRRPALLPRRVRPACGR